MVLNHKSFSSFNDFIYSFDKYLLNIYISSAISGAKYIAVNKLGNILALMKLTVYRKRR